MPYATLWGPDPVPARPNVLWIGNLPNSVQAPGSPRALQRQLEEILVGPAAACPLSGLRLPPNHKKRKSPVHDMHPPRILPSYHCLAELASAVSEICRSWSRS